MTAFMGIPETGTAIHTSMIVSNDSWTQSVTDTQYSEVAPPSTVQGHTFIQSFTTLRNENGFNDPIKALTFSLT